MRLALAVVALLLFAAPAEVQLAQLPQNIPHLCQGDPNKVTVPAGQSVALSGILSCVEVFGEARVFGLLRVGTILVYPGGALIQEDASETVWNCSPFTSADLEQFGCGLVIVDGVWRAQGRQVQSHMRLIVEPLAGTSTLSLATIPQGWQIGDRIVIGDTRQLQDGQWFDAGLALQHETRQIASMNGATITLDAPLMFAHRGARDADGTLKLLPHVGNLTRSIVMRSEDPNGVRGHVLVTGTSTVDVHGVAFVNMGRTTIAPLGTSNRIGRYAVHFHHLRGPANPTNTGYQYIFEGNAIEGSSKWGLAIHNTHHGLVQNNVIYGAGNQIGAGIALEDGSETDNRIEGNFLVDIRGDVNPRSTLPSTADGTTPGAGGDGIWGAGFNNRIIDNVIVGARNAVQQVASGSGIKLALAGSYFYTVRVPLFRGADTNDPTQSADVQPQRQPILEMRGNEVYGLAATGFVPWWLGTNGYEQITCQPSFIRDFTVWHTHESAFWGYPSCGVTLENLTYRVSGFDPYGGPTAIASGDYRQINLTVRNADIHAGSLLRGTIDPIGTFVFEDVRAKTRFDAFTFQTPASPGNGADRSGLSIAMRLIGGSFEPWPGQSMKTVSMFHNLTQHINTQPFEPYIVTAQNYQGQAGNDFQIYFNVQATTSQYYGGQAPCSDTTTRPEIAGITCGVSLPPPPPPPNRPPNVTASCGSATCVTEVGQSITLTATAFDADDDQLTFQWSGSGTFTAPTSATTGWSASGAGDYLLSITVNDGRGGTSDASVAVTVTEPPTTLAIELDALTTITTDNGDDPSFTHVTSGSPSLALVSISKRRACTVDGVLYGTGGPMSLAVSSTDGARGAFIFALANPPPGNQVVTVQTSCGAFLAVIAVQTFTGTTTIGATSAAQGTGASASASVASTTGDLVVDTLFKHNADAVTPNAGQTERWDLSRDNVRGFGSTAPGASSVTMGASWASATDWFYVAVNLVLVR